MTDQATPKPRTPGVYEVPSVRDTEDDFPDTWGDEPGGYSHNEPEAEPLESPSPLNPGQPL